MLRILGATGEGRQAAPGASRRWRRALLGGALGALTVWGALWWLDVWRAERDARTWASWFSGEVIPEIELRFDAAARAALEDEPREFVRAELVHEGRQLIVGARLKGHRSMRPLGEKAAFKIDVARYEKKQRFFGVRRLTLNNMVEDPSGLREFFGYRLFRELGVSSPRAGYASVVVNAEPYGVYALLEDTEQFVERTSPRGARSLVYEGEYGCDVIPRDVPALDRDYGKDPGRQTLRALADAAEGDPGRLFDSDGPLDMKAFLAHLAASTVVGDYDGYWHAHNYRLYYRAPPHKWQLSPWGLDRIFQRPLEPFDSQGLLARLCFADPSCRVGYVGALRDVVKHLEKMDLPSAARTMAAKLDQLPSMGSVESKTARRTKAAREQLVAFSRARPAQIRERLGCVDEQGHELDGDGDGAGCLDCDDTNANLTPGAPELCDGVDNDCSGVADDAAECGCPERIIDGLTYHLCNWPRPWLEAEQTCEQMGLVLARIDSKHASKALYAEARSMARSAWWIGYSDHSKEGHFTWREGDPGSFTYWDRGQPNNRSCNEHCAALRPGRRGRWQDTPCQQRRPFICAAPRSRPGND